MPLLPFRVLNNFIVSWNYELKNAHLGFLVTGTIPGHSSARCFLCFHHRFWPGSVVTKGFHPKSCGVFSDANSLVVSLELMKRLKRRQSTWLNKLPCENRNTEYSTVTFYWRIRLRHMLTFQLFPLGSTISYYYQIGETSLD